MVTAHGPMRIDSLCDGGRGGVSARQAGLPAAARELHQVVLRAFLRTGAPPHLLDLPEPAGSSREEVLARLAEVDLVHLDAQGRVSVAYPFSGRATGHTVRLGDGPALQAMCAIDALGVPLMAGRDGVISSTDPVDGQPVRVERRGETWQWAPATTVVLLAQSEGHGAAAECMCPAITFHRDQNGAKAHLLRRPELTGLVLEQRQALDIARWSFASLLVPDVHTAHTQPAVPTGELR